MGEKDTDGGGNVDHYRLFLLYFSWRSTFAGDDDDVGGWPVTTSSYLNGRFVGGKGIFFSSEKLWKGQAFEALCFKSFS